MVAKAKDSVTFVYKGSDSNSVGTKVTVPHALAKTMGYKGADPSKKAAAKPAAEKPEG